MGKMEKMYSSYRQIMDARIPRVKEEKVKVARRSTDPQSPSYAKMARPAVPTPSSTTQFIAVAKPKAKEMEM